MLDWTKWPKWLSIIIKDEYLEYFTDFDQFLPECILSGNISGKSVVSRRGGGGGGGGGDVGEQVITDQLQVSERFANITRYQGAQYQEE